MSPSSSPTTPRLRFLHIALLGACAALAACGGGQTDAGTESSPAAQEVNAADGDAATNEEYGVGANAAAVESDAAAAPAVATAGTEDSAATFPLATAALVGTAAVDPANVSVPGTVTTPNPTLQNITVEWAFTGDANANAVVNVRYRKTGSSTWSNSLPLRRISAGTTQGKSWATRHSGSVFDLQPATAYDIELALVDADGGSSTRTVNVTTRAVPAPMAGAPIKPATPSTFKTVMAAAQPGDIIELAAGTYTSFTVSKDGSEAKPIVIRPATGVARSAVVVSGELSLIGRKYVQIRGLTVNGRIRYNSSLGLAIVGNQVNAQTSVGNGDGIVTWNASENAYIADNTVVGTTLWNTAALGNNGANRGEGILVAGPGHVVMNNRVRGFRDNISLLEDSGAVRQYSIDILHRRVVAGPLVLARQLVDACRPVTDVAAACSASADQDVVDAQALVLAEGQVAVVPPAPALGRLLEQPEGIHQAQPEQGAGSAHAPRRAVDLAGPGDRVVDVAVLGRDVEVAHQHQLRMLPSSARSQVAAPPASPSCRRTCRCPAPGRWGSRRPPPARHPPWPRSPGPARRRSRGCSSPHPVPASCG
jgi:hypothetical protein